MEVHCPLTVVQKNDSSLDRDDTAGASSRSPSNAWLQRSGVFFLKKHRTPYKALSSTAISRNQHNFAALCMRRRSKFYPQGDPLVLCLQRTGNWRLQGDPSVSCYHTRVSIHLQGDPSIFPHSHSFFPVPDSFWQRRRQIVFYGSITEGSSSSHQVERENLQDHGDNGTLSSSSFSSSSSSSSSPTALSAEACAEISFEELSETKRLVETAMLAAAAGLAYFLSNTLRIENYFGCFFPLPLVIASLRWGVIAGRKTMAATAMLLLVLSGPLKAATYLLMHGFLGLTMGSLWRSKMSWGASVLICTLVRSLGAMGFVFLSSWLIRENILALITINAHASISFMLAAMGINFVPSMGSIYFIFGILVLLNCGSFVLILHVLYAIFLKRLGLYSPLIFPAWLKTL